MIITGKVISGFGRAKEFMKNKHYAEQFVKNFDFTPHAGSLNIKVNFNFDVKTIEKFEKIIIFGNDENKNNKKVPKLGSVIAYRIKINDSVSGALIFPEKSTHDKSILEIIAPFNLRETFNIEDGDDIKIEIIK